MRRTIWRGASVLFILLLILPCEAKKPKKKMALYYLQFQTTGSITWPNDDSLDVTTGTFTVSLWVKGVIHVTKVAFAGPGWAINTSVNQAAISGVATGYTVTSTTDLDNGSWHHIVFTRDSSHLLSIYVDGSLEGTTQAYSVDISNSGTLKILSTSSNGCFDDLRFYDGVALAANQVSNIYNDGVGVRVKEKGFEKITSNGFYASCDDGSGTTPSGRKLSSGTWSDNDGSFSSGDLTWVEGGVPFDSQELTSDYEEYTYYINTTSKEIQFCFDGREDFEIREFKILEPITEPPKPVAPTISRYYFGNTTAFKVNFTADSVYSPGTDPFTLAFWAKYTSVFQIYGSGATTDIYFRTNYIRLSDSGAGTTYTATATTTLTDGNWHHIVCTRDSSNDLKIYVDGSLEATTADASVDLSSMTQFYIQASAGNTQIQDFRFYNGAAFNAQQVLNIYNDGCGVRVKEKGFQCIVSNGFYVGYDEGSGSTLAARKISSGTWSAYNATVSSGALTWTAGGIPFNHRELTSEWAVHTLFSNVTSKRIQFCFDGREDFEIKSFKVLEPVLLGDR